MRNKIEFLKRMVYGVERLYPNCDKSVALCNIINDKTFDRKKLKFLNELGFDVEITSGDVEKFEAEK